MEVFEFLNNELLYHAIWGPFEIITIGKYVKNLMNNAVNDYYNKIPNQYNYQISVFATDKTPKYFNEELRPLFQINLN